MLKELYIENLAVIKKANIDFTNNLNVFTGETGAGKSILINGINALLGQRITKDIVRNGTDKAVISALFTDIPNETVEKLNEYGFDSSDNQVTISREISSDGGSVARINGRAVTVSAIREIGSTLINIHGQHDNQILLSPEKHIDILDQYADDGAYLDDYRASFRKLQDVARKISKATSEKKDIEFKVSKLSSLVLEIDALGLKENEDVDLEKEFNLMKNAVVLSEAVNLARAFLNGDDETDGAVSLSGSAYDEISAYSDEFPDLEPLAERLKNASIELDDILLELNRFSDKLEVDPQRYDYISKRIEEINKLKKKYGPELSDVLEAYEKASDELSTLLMSDDQILELTEKKNSLLAEVSKKAKVLSDVRKKAGERFVSQVTEVLTFLDMPNVKLEVSQTNRKLTSNGMDNIEFLISVNLGEPVKPIAKIASGGELSRIMLALKNVIAQNDGIPTLIFDEIDTGVSGRAAQKIGIKLSDISSYTQVLCVTHLAQIAVMADNHILIEKNTEDEKTVTSVKSLNFDERKLEIARIMGGANISELMLKNAEELILNSKKHK